MPRYPKGILGVPKKPSNQILFSFKAREGEEWPSDEEDSDYNPGSVCPALLIMLLFIPLQTKL